MAVNIQNGQVKNLHIGPDIITDGLVSWCNVASIRSYPRTGAVWYDLIKKHQNNGSLINMSSTNFSNEGGGVLLFDAADEVVDIADNSTIDFGTNSFTTCVWTKLQSELTSASNGGYLLGKRGDGTAGDWAGWQIRARNVGVSRGWVLVDSGVDDGSTAYMPLTSSIFNFDEWYMISLVHNTDDKYVRLYINDTLVGARNYTSLGTISNTIPLEFAGTRYYNHYYYGFPVNSVPCAIGNVAMYQRALTLEDIIYNWLSRYNAYSS